MQSSWLKRIVWVAVFGLFSTVNGAAEHDSTVIMIGIDGLHANAIDRVAAPNLRHLAETGVRAKSMIPAMPTKTFVNFYSIATGLYPEHHGMISNSPYDRTIDRQFNAREDVQNPFWWSGEPIWITAEKQGVKAATYFWVGSEVAIDGLRPSFWKPYQQSKDYAERIEEVLAWLDLPKAQRPRLVTLYFSAVDSAVHSYGVGSEQEQQAILRVDRHIGDLLAGLKDRGIRESTDIVIVSDHGMANLSTERLVNLDNWLELQDWRVTEWRDNDPDVSAPFLSLFGSDEQVEQAYALLKNADPHMQVYRPQDFPQHYHFAHQDRVPDLFLLADPEWEIFASRHAANKDKIPLKVIKGATHGYDNHSQLMQATFIANGPDFVQGSRVEAFENIEVYGVLACILALKPAKTDGDIKRVASMLTKSCQL